jgi:hypothetical protein
MTLVGIVTALSERFLRERTFELIVAPAIADLQFDEGRPDHHLNSRIAVLAAFGWALYEDLTNDSGALTFAALTLLPAAYYTALAVFVLRLGPSHPADLPFGWSGAADIIAVACVIAVLSLGPAIACYWPERRPRRVPTETP